MHPLDEQSLRLLFAEAKKENAFDSNVAQLVKDLSQAIADMQHIGIDVSLDVSARCGERHFALFKNATISAAGMLTVGNNEHLFAIAKKEVNSNGVTENCLKIGLSQLNMRYEVPDSKIINAREIRSTVRSVIIDAMQPDAMVTFQKFVLKQAAGQEILKELDIRQSFKPQSSGLKFLKKDFNP